MSCFWQGEELVNVPLHLEVSHATEEAVEVCMCVMWICISFFVCFLFVCCVFLLYHYCGWCGFKIFSVCFFRRLSVLGGASNLCIWTKWLSVHIFILKNTRFCHAVCRCLKIHARRNGISKQFLTKLVTNPKRIPRSNIRLIHSSGRAHRRRKKESKYILSFFKAEGKLLQSAGRIDLVFWPDLNFGQLLSLS